MATIMKPSLLSEFCNKEVTKVGSVIARVWLVNPANILKAAQQNSLPFHTVDETSIIILSRRNAVKYGLFHGSVVLLKQHIGGLSDNATQGLTAKYGFSNQIPLPGGNEETPSEAAPAQGPKITISETTLSPSTAVSSESFCRPVIVYVADCELIESIDKELNSMPHGDALSELSADQPRVIISTHLWFNLCRASGGGGVSLDNDHVKFCEISVARAENAEAMTRSQCFNYVVYSATRASISAVVNPSYTWTELKDELLALHFSKPRWLCVGDIFSIYSPVEQVVVHYKVESTEREGALTNGVCAISSEKTSLYMEGSTQAYVPLGRLPVGHSSVTHWTSTAEQLVNLILPYLSDRHRLLTNQNLYPILLLSGPAGCGKTLTCSDVAAKLNMNHYTLRCSSLVSDTAAAFEAKLKNALAAAVQYRPCLITLESVELINKDRSGVEDGRTARIFFDVLTDTLREVYHSAATSVSKPSAAIPTLKTLGSSATSKSSATTSVIKPLTSSVATSAVENILPVVVIATCQSDKQLSTDLYQGFIHCATIRAPDSAERRRLLEVMLPEYTTPGCDIDCAALAHKTAGYVARDLSVLVSLARKSARERHDCEVAEQLIRKITPRQHPPTDGVLGDRVSNNNNALSSIATVTNEDFDSALKHMQAASADSIGAPKVPNVSWADVGGLEEAKQSILDTIQLPLLHPELCPPDLNRSGVLLYGPPGTGKTLLAKAVATECNINFLSVKGPELLNMYVGQSEENIREVFSRASAAAPCVIFFDELDSLAPNRGRSGDSGGVMDRVVSQLLAELDGLSKAGSVFVIGATNRPDLIDPALLRPGRFDKLVHLGVNTDETAQLSVLKALTRNFNLSDSCDLQLFVRQRCSGREFSGADFYAVCSDALQHAIRRTLAHCQATGGDINEAKLCVTEEDFENAFNSVVSSKEL